MEWKDISYDDRISMISLNIGEHKVQKECKYTGNLEFNRRENFLTIEKKERKYL